MSPPAGAIRVGVGGWVYEPWRDNFYPAGLAQTRELEYLSRRSPRSRSTPPTTGTQKPASFAKWRDATPDDFVFSRQGDRATRPTGASSREAGESIERFLASGLAELGPKLGPIVWQFATTKAFDARRFRGLPEAAAGTARRPARCATRSRCGIRASWRAEYLALARRHGVATVFADSDDYPSFADPTADFVYARLMRTESRAETGYPPERSPPGPTRARRWSEGASRRRPAARRGRRPRRPQPRDVFLFFISGAKERAPAAAVATLAALGLSPAGRLIASSERKGKGLAALPQARPRARWLVAMRRDCGRTGRSRWRG